MKYLLGVGMLGAMLSCQPKEATRSIELPVDTYFQYFNAHDWESMAAMYDSVSLFKDPAFGPGTHTMTRPDIIKKYQELAQIIPDVRDSVISKHQAGEYLTVEFISKGTQPDGKPFELPICTIMKWKDGKIVEDFTYYYNF